MRGIFTVSVLAVMLAAVPVNAQKRAAGGSVPKAHPMKVDRTSNAELPIEKFQKMSPAERNKALAKLPQARREAVQRRLEQYNRLTPEEKARFQQFSALPPERQQAMRKAYNGVTRLEPDRQQAVRDEVRQMRGLSASERDTRIGSEEFRSRFSPKEQKLIEELRDLPQ